MFGCVGLGWGVSGNDVTLSLQDETLSQSFVFDEALGDVAVSAGFHMP